jgi:hypothetical protein
MICYNNRQFRAELVVYFPIALTSRLTVLQGTVLIAILLYFREDLFSTDIYRVKPQIFARRHVSYILPKYPVRHNVIICSVIKVKLSM